MTPNEDEGVVSFRLQSLEKRLERLENGFSSKLDQIQTTIGSLAYVSKDVYRSDQAAVNERIAAANERVDSARAIAMWALAATVGAALSALFLLLKAAS